MYINHHMIINLISKPQRQNEQPYRKKVRQKWSRQDSDTMHTFSIRDASANPIELKDVYPALYDATEKWIDIGLQLNVKSHDLKRIETNFQHNTDRLRETLNLRLNQGDLTWEHVTEALENRTIGHKTLADEIRSKYITPQPTTTTPVKRGT